MIDTSSPAYIKTSSDARQAMDKIGANLSKVLAELQVTSEEALLEIAQNILNESNNIAPMDTGEMIDSSYIASEVTDGNITIEVGYKDPKAVYQHELYGTSYKNPTTPGTMPKFLQTAATEVESDIPARVADALKNKLGT
jgi:hypothetical protein